MTTNKIDFFIRGRPGGGFTARAFSPPLEAEADTLAQLRLAIRRLVRRHQGLDTPVCLRVGQVVHAPASQPEPRRPGAAIAPAVPALTSTP